MKHLVLLWLSGFLIGNASGLQLARLIAWYCRRAAFKRMTDRRIS